MNDDLAVHHGDLVASLEMAREVISGPRISVVMTVYNQAAFLSQAIDSVLSQDPLRAEDAALAQGRQDFELIVVDDGSTDGARAVTDRYASRVRYIRRENGGLAAARNTGIEQAKGEFVAFCDADDVQLPFRLKAQLRVLERVPQAALVFSELSPYRDGRVLSDTLLRDKVMGPMRRSFDEEIACAFQEAGTCVDLGVPVPTAHKDRSVRWGRVPGLIALAHIAWGGASMTRRAVLIAMGGHDETLRRYVDWELTSRISKAYPLAFLDVPVLLYRLHGSQLTKNAVLGAECYRYVIEKVWRSDPVAYAQHRAIIDRCLGSAHWGLGRAAFAAGDFRRAAQSYLSSVCVYPRQKTAYVDLLKSYAARLSSMVGR